MKKIMILIVGMVFGLKAITADQYAEFIGQSSTFAVGMGVGHGIQHVIAKMKVLQKEGRSPRNLRYEDKKALEQVIKDQFDTLPQSSKERISQMSKEEFNSFLDKQAKEIRKSLVDRGLPDQPVSQLFEGLTPNLRNNLLDPGVSIKSDVIGNNYEFMQVVQAKYAEGGSAGAHNAVKALLTEAQRRGIKDLKEFQDTTQFFNEEHAQQLEEMTNEFSNLEIGPEGLRGKGAVEMEGSMAEMMPKVMPEFIEG